MTDWNKWKISDLKQYIAEHDPSALPVRQRPTKAELAGVAERVHRQLQRRETKRAVAGRSSQASPRKRRQAQPEESVSTPAFRQQTSKSGEPRVEAVAVASRSASPTSKVVGLTGSGSVTATSRSRRTPSARQRSNASKDLTSAGALSSRKRARRSPLRGEEARRRLVGDDIPEDRSPDGGAWADLKQPRYQMEPRVRSGSPSPATLIRSLRQTSPTMTASTVTTSPNRQTARPRASSTSWPSLSSRSAAQAPKLSSPTPSASSGVGLSSSSRVGLREAFRDVLSMMKPLDRTEPTDYIEFPEQVLPVENDAQEQLNLSTQAPSAITPDEGELLPSPVRLMQGVEWRNSRVEEDTENALALRRDLSGTVQRASAGHAGASMIEQTPWASAPVVPVEAGTMETAALEQRERSLLQGLSNRQRALPAMPPKAPVDDPRLAAMHDQVSAVLSRIRRENSARTPVQHVTASPGIEAESAGPFLGREHAARNEISPAPDSTGQRSSLETEAQRAFATIPELRSAPSPLQAFRQLRQARDPHPSNSSAALSPGTPDAAADRRGLAGPQNDALDAFRHRVFGEPDSNSSYLRQPTLAWDGGRLLSIGQDERSRENVWRLSTSTPLAAGDDRIPSGPGQERFFRDASVIHHGIVYRILRRYWRAFAVLAILVWFAFRIYLILPLVPYCDSSDTGQATNRACRPCPQQGICVGGVLTCREGYVVLGGKCAPDRELNRYAHIIQSQIHRILSESAGRFQCGERAIRWKWTESELREAIEQLPFMEGIVSSSKWEAAFRRALDTLDHPFVRSTDPTADASAIPTVTLLEPADMDQDDVLPSGNERNATDGDPTDRSMANAKAPQRAAADDSARTSLSTSSIVMYWSTEPQLPLWCRIWRIIQYHLAFLLWLTAAMVVLTMIVTRWQRKRRLRRLIEHLQRAVYRRLQEQKQRHLAAIELGRMEAVPPFLVDVHLRDELVGEVADVGERQRLWQAVVSRIRSDSRIHLRYETFADGRRAVVWEWTAPLSPS